VYVKLAIVGEPVTVGIAIVAARAIAKRKAARKFMSGF
jgi:hypothetical protein